MSTVELEPPTTETSIRLDQLSNGMAMTPEEFDAVEDWDDDFRYELVRGVLIVVPPAGIGETKPNDELGYWLRQYRDTHPKGSSMDDSCYEVWLKTTNGRRRADRVVWCGYGDDLDYNNDVPTIAIEFVANSARDRRRDYIEKRAEYAEIGVKEYWVIDRFRRTLTVYRNDETESVYQEGATVTTELLPGFELDLKRLLEIADRAAK